jgi:hypothetical protein
MHNVVLTVLYVLSNYSKLGHPCRQSVAHPPATHTGGGWRSPVGTNIGIAAPRGGG